MLGDFAFVHFEHNRNQADDCGNRFCGDGYFLKNNNGKGLGFFFSCKLPLCAVSVPHAKSQKLVHVDKLKGTCFDVINLQTWLHSHF